MKYDNIVRGEFIERKNRFVAAVRLGGDEVTVHVKNTGRCKELLIPGAGVYLVRQDSPGRRTPYDLVAVEKKTKDGTLLINMDSFAPNIAVGEWLPGGLFSRDAKIYTERRFGNSRFDFYIEDGTRTAYLEVKGVTLEEDGVVSFPDAPTERGVRHLRELESCLKQGHEAYAVFVIQMDRARVFMPNGSTHREFEEALCHAQAAGVKVLAYSCRVAPDSMSIADPVKVRLKGE